MLERSPRSWRRSRSDGLRVDGEARPAHATSEPRELFGVQVLFVFVRATDTLRALRPFAAELSPATAIVSLQNGLGNEEAIKTSLGGTISLVIGATTESALTVGPGEVRRIGDGTTVLGSAGASPETINRVAAAAGRRRVPRQRRVRHPPAPVGQADRERRDQPRRGAARPPERRRADRCARRRRRALARAGSGDGRERDAHPAAVHRSVVVRAHDRRANRRARQLDALRPARRRADRGRFHQRRGRRRRPPRRRSDAVQRNADRAGESARRRRAG